ncbi:uncharacterized protein LOC133173922 [Saccostrea echinata]|uniref:uncharacterized protein LOC133173922 n=1 Tax=Saccostrea echinata TaxID=191078 RepID=UPI002A80C926|nr:uncharacterized protein LOC133173922 [Saccostrea echinata]
MFHCTECPELSFERRSLCERHVFEKHSGFGYQCTICLKVFNRPDNHSGRCVGNELLLRKKSTKTFTEEEAEEHRKFMKSLSQKIFVKKEDLRRTPSERHQIQQNNRKRSHQRSLSNTQEEKENQQGNKRTRSEDTRKVMEKESRDKVKPARPSALQDQTSKNTNQEPEIRSQKEKAPAVETSRPEDDCLSLYAGEFSDTEIQEAFEEIVQAMPRLDNEVTFPPLKKISSAPSTPDHANLPSTSASCSTSSSQTNPQDSTYSPTEKENKVITAPNYIATPKTDERMKRVKESQRKRLILNIGGRRFETSVSTLMTKPQALLARMISPSGIKPYSVDNVYTYFIDRNPNNFSVILDYLRNGGDLPLDALPNDIRALREITLEAKFYELKHLELLSEKKIMELKSEELSSQLAILNKM